MLLNSIKKAVEMANTPTTINFIITTNIIEFGFGSYHNDKKTIGINLAVFTDGNHRNNDDYDCDPSYNEDKMIEDICFTINHEVIHLAEDTISDIRIGSIKSERIAYYMAGNGHNQFFNRWYDIPRNIEWENSL